MRQSIITTLWGVLFYSASVPMGFADPSHSRQTHIEQGQRVFFESEPMMRNVIPHGYRYLLFNSEELGRANKTHQLKKLFQIQLQRLHNYCLGHGFQYAVEFSIELNYKEQFKFGWVYENINQNLIPITRLKLTPLNETYTNQNKPSSNSLSLPFTYFSEKAEKEMRALYQQSYGQLYPHWMLTHLVCSRETPFFDVELD